MLPLTAGPSQVIPIPLIVDTEAPEFVYLCTSAALALSDVGALTQTTQRGYEYQLHGSLQCPRDVELYDPMANALPYSYERVEPHDIRHTAESAGHKGRRPDNSRLILVGYLKQKRLGHKDRTAGIPFLPMIKN